MFLSTSLLLANLQFGKFQFATVHFHLVLLFPIESFRLGKFTGFSHLTGKA